MIVLGIGLGLLVLIVYYIFSQCTYCNLVYELNESINSITVLLTRRQKNFSILLTELQRERDILTIQGFSMEDMNAACVLGGNPYLRIGVDEKLDSCIEKVKTLLPNNKNVITFLGVDSPLELNLRAVRKKYMKSLLVLDRASKKLPYSLFIKKRGFPYALYSLSKFDS